MKALLSKILLLCGSIIFALLLLEIVLRIFPVDDSIYYRKITWGHWENTDMANWYRKEYAYDSLLGYERKEVYEEIKKVVREKDVDYKILILGDSISYEGKYVDYFRDLVSEKYKNSEIKIINAGVTGYDTTLEYKYLKYRGLDLKPDLVILQFCMNDFIVTPVIIKQKDGSWLALEGTKWNRRINPTLLMNSKAYEFITLRVLNILDQGNDFSYNNVPEPLSNIKNLLEKENIPFIFLIFPPFSNEKADIENYNAIMRIVEELNLTSKTIDLTPYYFGIPFEKITREPGHPNVEGDKIAAFALVKDLTPLLDKQLNREIST